MQILSQTEVWRWLKFFEVAAPIAAFAFIVLLILTIVCDSGVCSQVAAILFAVTVILTIFGVTSNAHRYTDYKVTLDESVSVKEFLNKYELLDIDGEIYEIREYITE